MSGDQSFKKSGSPRSSTEVSSLQVNRIKNKEALEKGLRCRRSVKELVNQGILLNPFISHPDKVRQLQRAKTSDLLKHKIEKRPDRQYLINRRIIRDDKPGTSPFILERCHSLEKHHLQSSLSSKLTTRPGSLELIEKGVLQVDPGVDSLVRCGSIQYPRVESPSPYAPLESIAESEPIPTPPPIPSSAVISPQCTNPADLGTSSANVGRTRINSTSRSSGSSSRSIREETVVYKLGSLVFHNYCPKTTHSFSPSICSSASFQQKQKAREAQQADLLRLQDTARVHRLVEQEINKRANLASHGPSPVLKLAGEIPTTSTAALFVNGQKIPGKPVDVFSPFPFSPTSTCSVETPFSVAAMSVDSAEYSLTPNPNDFSATNSPMISTPVAHLSLNINGSSVHSLESFERLTLTQLKAECRQRKLPRSGLKATLIKQLEPYANEILPKYFPDSESIPKDGAKTDQKNVSVVGSPQAVVLKSSASSPAPAPVWTAPVPSPPSSSSCSSSLTTSSQAPIFTLNGVNTNSLITASTVQNGVFVYSVSQSSASRPQLNQPTNISSLSLLNNSQTLLVQHQQQPNVVVNQCASLHHSYSAPYMIQTSSLPSSQTQPQVQPTTCSLTKQPTIYIASDLFSFTHAANLLSTANGRIASTGAGQPLLATTTNGVLVRSVMLNGLPSLCQQGTDAPPQHSAAGEVMVQATTTTPHATPPPPPSKALNSKKPLVHAASLSNIPSPKKQEAASGHSGQPPSLNQIEEVWLRIRQLRRLIAKASDDCNDLAH
ncbi:unnamed protein product [Calicophoron daubneyi]|uniref:SAP domain-containing protein n=1 Tax=Calicophoron daubneyi TaxID=300641 RepID=A0AAV2TM91_CALDB